MSTKPFTAKKIDGLKIAHTADTARGATWMAEQLRELRNYGHSVTSIIPDEGELSRKLNGFDVNYSLHKIGFPWHSRDALSSVTNIYRLAHHFFSERYQVVHHHLYPSMVYSRFAAWIADVPVRVSMIPGPFYMDAEIPRAVELSSCWLDSRVIVSCRYSGQQYRQSGVPAQNLELVYYGADETIFTPSRVDSESARKSLLEELDLDDDAPLVGMVAYFYSPLTESRHYPESVWNKSIKGHETLIEAVPQILSVCPKARFLFIGDGWGEPGMKLMQDLKASVAQKGLSDYVHFVGHRDHVPEILSTLSISLQLSRSENLGGTIESLLMGRPLIATRVGGMVDSVKHEQTGLLVEMDDADGLAQAICRLLEQPDFARELGDAGRNLMLREFCLSQTVRQLNEIYNRCYEELGHPGYRLPVVAFRALIAPFLLIGILALQFRYEIEGKTGNYFSDLYRPVSAFQNRLSQLVQPLFRQDGDAPIMTVAAFAMRLFPVFFFWMAYPFVATKLRMKERLIRLSQSGELLPFYHPKVVMECFRSLFSTSLTRVAKRLFDVVVAGTLLLLFSPIFAAFWISAKKTRTPVFERHTVLGRRNQRFSAYLFSACDNGGILSRCIWMPLLINIVMGHMSIVGTRIRPNVPLSDRPENHPTSWTSRPGLTGWCHLNTTGNFDFDTLNGLDILYMVNWSPMLDVRILLKTIRFQLRKPLAGLFFDKYWLTPSHGIAMDRTAEAQLALAGK